VEIDVVSDPVCPWCYLGSVRLDRVLESVTEPVKVTYRPFLLDSTTPEGGLDIADMLRKKYGVDPRAAWDRVEGAARESGLTLDLTRQKRQYPTLRAHTLLRHAEPRGTQRALARALFEANFDQALNISDTTVLGSLGERHGFSADEVAALVTDERELAATRAEIDGALASGIRGVPFFVFDGKVAVSGAQRESVLAEALRRAQETTTRA
jgi:predicted DsbA family dithiol-disulfide isomerase